VTPAAAQAVLAIDPGSDKCGLAIVGPSGVHLKEVVKRVRIVERVGELLAQHEVRTLVLGDATGARPLRRDLFRAYPKVPIELVSERGSTLEARQRYFDAHPPRGWRRLIPRTMQLPSEPFDDFVAVILAERFMLSEKSEETRKRGIEESSAP